MGATARRSMLLIVLLGVLAYAAFLSREDASAPGTRVFASADPDAGKVTGAGPEAVAPGGGAGRYALPDRAPLNEQPAEFFGSRSWEPPPPKVAAAPPPKPVAPPMPYRFAGQFVQDGQPEVFLAKGDAVVRVRTGDTLDGVYRVQAIDGARITLVYLPLKEEQTIPVNSVLAAELAGDRARAAPERSAPQSAQTAPAAPTRAARGARTAATSTPTAQ